MPDNYYPFNRNNSGGYRLGAAHEHLDLFMKMIVTELATSTAMIDGDGSNEAHYNQHVLSYGYASTADAKAAHAELAALVGKLTSDGSQTNVLAAINQFLARFRS